MHPDLVLRVLAALADYLLKTTFAFGLCFVSSQLMTSAKARLTVWLSFLSGSAGYWLWLVQDVVSPGRSAAQAFSRPLPVLLPPAVSATGNWHLPGSWTPSLGLALKVAGILYLVALAFFLHQHLKQWWRLRWVMKFTTSAPAAIEDRFQILADELGGRHTRLLVLSGANSPATFGWLRPVVLLPDICLQQNPFDLDDILLHELHHVRRWDFLWSQLATACRSLVFFQPACWYAMKRVNLEREVACDLAVVTKAPERRATYAECLVRFARLHAARQEQPWGVDFAASQHLKVRVQSILAGYRKLPLWSIFLRAAATVVLAVGFVAAVPSLGVLLSYTRETPRPVDDQLIETTPVIATKKPTANHRIWKSSQWPSPVAARSAPVGQDQPSPQPGSAGAEAVADLAVGEPATSSSSGPQLMRRPSPGTAPARSARQRIIEINDQAATQADGKAADRKQAIEQTATTALGLYRRLGAVDRH